MFRHVAYFCVFFELSISFEQQSVRQDEGQSVLLVIFYFGPEQRLHLQRGKAISS